MKKHQILSLLLAIALLVPMASCVDNAPKSDVWDGTVAEGFSKGDGSKEAPFEISTSAELAYLAKSTNAGNTYADKFFSLKCDLDLNDIEWTPIGTRSSQFSGSFDGNAHTISNLKMTDTVSDTVPLPSGSGGTYQIDYAGLFGFCNNAGFSNLILDGVELSTKNAYSLDNISIGALAAFLYTTKSDVKNINVKNAIITRNSAESNPPPQGIREDYFGGIFGGVYAYENGYCKLDQIQADVYFGLSDTRNTDITLAGGIIGDLHSAGTFECSNFAVYTDGKFMDTIENWAFISYSAIGRVANPGKIKLCNGFSKIKIDQSFLAPGNMELNGLSANAIIGRSHIRLDGTFEFENLFGYVNTSDDLNADHVSKLFFLAESAVYTETNCKMTDTLPENHGFDTSVWDVSESSSPKLK